MGLGTVLRKAVSSSASPATLGIDHSTQLMDNPSIHLSHQTSEQFTIERSDWQECNVVGTVLKFCDQKKGSHFYAIRE